ncbi:glycosyltransferase family 2 protein, partial [Acidithiobacillus sp. MC6.1]|nr:glycosyltransferase family 2 protein [Acidithiobacillus sp. MC6.1]
DDDNCPQLDALSVLQGRHQQLALTTSPSLLAVTAFRPVGQSGAAPRYLIPKHSSYAGFHVGDIPRKLFKRIPGASLLYQRSKLPAVVPLEIAPYSGMLFSRDLVQRIGLPRSDFVLYCDDYEWSYRITRLGGRIELVSQAIVTDLQKTRGSAHSNHPKTLLQGNGDSIAYYMMRNEAYFYKTLWCKNKSIHLFNEMIFSFLLWFISKATRSDLRYQLLRRAIQDGSSGTLGANPEFPL